MNQSNLHTHQATLVLIKGPPLSDLFLSAFTKRTQGMSCNGFHALGGIENCSDDLVVPGAPAPITR
jgi:hypothetical protein